jgi:hypothetical protein
MYQPALFRDRPRPVQIVAGGVVPAAIGAVAGVLVGVSTGAYWAIGGVAAVGGVLAGFEHQDGWGGADRGLVGGAIYGVGLLVAHAIAGTHAKVSLGSFPPLLAVVTAIIGIFLGAAGGRIARFQREHQAALTQTTDPATAADPAEAADPATAADPAEAAEATEAVEAAEAEQAE